MKKILIIDDDPGVLVFLQRKLQAAGYVTLTFLDGEEGLACMRVQNPDLVIFDVMMPGLDGYSLLAEIRADESLTKIPLIVVTAKKELQDFFMAQGVQGFVSKPFNVDVVLEKVRVVIGDQYRALVVDDDPGFLRLMEGILTKLACKVHCCENGKQAVEYLKKNQVDICFMDILMPEMGGIEASFIIRQEISKKLPIVAITSSNMKVTKEKCVEVGIDDFIVKPPSVDIILKALSHHVLRKFNNKQ